MLFAFRLTVVLAVSASCLASAFSTLFVTEAAGEGRKTEGTETKTQKTAGNSVAENQVIVETIPFFTDVFTKVEDVMNLTPLKVATIISAQYLINTVKNIPVAGNLPHDTLNMLSTIVEQFNKTTQIIKLTAEYVNISSNYILTSLNQYAKDNCDQESVKTTMKTINQNFLDVISNHVKVAVREITEKTQQREMTGTDVLVSSAYHIVAAFQEMTNLVMSLKIDQTKCDFPQTPQNSEQVDSSKLENNKTVNILVRSKQDVHKSIKKDKALPQTDSIFKFPNRGNLQDSLVIENIDENPDLTIEIFPQKQLNLNNDNKEPLAEQEIKIPESFKVAFLSEKTEPKQQKLDLKNQFGFQAENNKITKKNLKNFEDIFTIKSINPNQDITLEIVSPQNLKNSNRQETGSKVNENKQQKAQGFNVYYYPLKTSLQNKNHPPNENMDKNLKVPEDFKGHYYPQTFYNEQNNLHREKLKQTFTPFKTLSLFGNYNPENKLSNKMSEGSQNHFKKFDDKSKEVNFDRQDLTVEVFSPETFLHKGKDESSEIKLERMDMQNIPSQFYRKKLDSRDFENYNFKKSPEHNHFNHKKSLDRELASSAVDSLSIVPPASYESKTEKVRNRKLTKPKVNTKGSTTVLTPWSKGFQQFLSPFSHKNQQKSNACHERVEPVCGIDKNKSNFIIFLNDCQRDHHNNVYKTSYEWADMDTCVRFLLKYSSGKPTSYMNAIPK